MVKKILIISMHPAPYREPVISKINEKYSCIDVLYLYNSDLGHTEWGLKYNKLEDIKKIKLPVLGDFHFGLLKLTKEYSCVLIPAWYPISLLVLMIFCILRRQKFVFSCDTINYKNDIAHKIINKIIRKADSFFVPGCRTKKYLQNTLCVEASKVYQGSYMLDNYKLYLRNKSTKIDTVYQKWGIPKNSFVFLFVGKFVQNRNIPLLCNAFDIFCSDGIPQCHLVVVGDGRYYNDNINNLIQKRSNMVTHIKRTTFDELSDLFALADCYIHPGKEPYSLATVQAVICALPVISSFEVGCVDDYVVDGKNGYIINTDDPLCFVERMKNVYLGLLQKEEMLNAQEKCIHGRNVNWAVSQLENALQID